MAVITDPKYLWKKRHDALFQAEVSALYHQKRERFFELLDKFSKAATLVGGSAALWRIADRDVVEKLAVVITGASALSLVFSFSDRSKRHAELAAGFRLIAADIVGKGESNFLESDINEWKEKIYKLCAKEPPALAALVLLCQNELALAAEQPGRVHRLPFWVRWLAHFLDMPRKA